MTRCFDFQQFTQLCPLTHEVVIDKLIDRYFTDYSGKRRQNLHHNLVAVIDATFALANQIGFAKMSMRDLHKTCGLSLGGLYNYFDSKEALAMMITEALHHIAFDWLPTVSCSTGDEDTSRAQQLEQLIRGHIYLSELLRPWFFFVFMEIKNLPEEIKAKARSVELSYQHLLDQLYASQPLPGSHVMALMQDWHIKQWKYRNTSIDEFADSVNRLAQTMLLAP